MGYRNSLIVATMVFILLTGSSALPLAKKAQPKVKATINFYDVRVQTPEFIRYNSIKLTPKQEKIKTDALSSIPAPCCSSFSMATCCCPCNLAKSVWGLSHFLIVKHNYGAVQLRQAVLDWIRFTHKNGFSGDACDMGRCGFPFAADGCGGMKEDQISF